MENPPQKIENPPAKDQLDEPVSSNQVVPAPGSPEEGRPRELEKKPRAPARYKRPPKQYVFPIPSPPPLPGFLWTELRRFITADVFTRQQRLKGQQALFPLGHTFWGEDSLEMALDLEKDPFVQGEEEEKRFRDLLDRVTVSMVSVQEEDPSRAVVDGDPAYFRWTQWLFIQFYRRGLLTCVVPGTAMEKGQRREDDAELPSEGRPPSFEEEIFEKKAVWMLDLSDYGDRLLNDLGKSHWPFEERNNQRHRIGRMRGCEVVFQASHPYRMELEEIRVFTTRVETIFGATFLLVQPWHPVVDSVIDSNYEEEVEAYRERVRRGVEPRVSGVHTGGFVINPATLERIPILVSKLALEPQKDGAIMGVPAHDPALLELAQRLRLPVKEVVRPGGAVVGARGKAKKAYVGDGNLIHSGSFNGLPVKVARDRIIAFLARRGICRRVTRFLLDQLRASAHSLWGVPVPLIHCPECGVVPVPDRDLPVLPPKVRRKHLRELAGKETSLDWAVFQRFTSTVCPLCHHEARRDPQVILNWVGESWMFLRHPAPELGGSVEGMNGPLRFPEGDEGGVVEEEEGAYERGKVALGENEGPDEEGEKPSISLESLDEETLFQKDPLAEPTRVPDLDELEEEMEKDVAAGESHPVGETSFTAPPSTTSLGRATGGDVPPGPKEAPSTEGEASGGTRLREGNERSRTEPGVQPATPAVPEPGSSRFQPFRSPPVRKWLPVDVAIGRSGHGALTILRTRFITKFLYDLRHVSFYEPFYRFVRVGTVRTENAEDQSGAEKVQELVQKYSVDAFRLYMISQCPPAHGMAFSENGLRGAQKFLNRIERHIALRLDRGKFVSRSVLVAKHHLIHDVTRAVWQIKLHNAVSAFHRFLNFLEGSDVMDEEMDRGSIRMFLILLWPFTPNLASDLWGRSEAEDPIETQSWPEASAELLQPVEVTVPVKIDNRVRCRVIAPPGLDSERLKNLVVDEDRVKRVLGDRQIDRIYAVSDRVVNILLQEPSRDEPETATPPSPPPPPPPA